MRNLRVRQQNEAAAIAAFRSREINFEIISRDDAEEDEFGNEAFNPNTGEPLKLFTYLRVDTDMTQVDISRLFAEFGFGTLYRGGDANSPNLKN